MFITEDEARRRLENSRNMFSESFSLPISRQEKVKKEESLDKDSSEDSSEDSSDDKLNDKQARQADKQADRQADKQRTSDIDRLLDGAVATRVRRGVRDRTTTLHGQIDAQVAIGATALVLGEDKTGPLFDLSPSQSGAYRVGMSSTADRREMIDRVPERSRRLRTVKEQLAEKASRRLSSALDSLTESKIDECSAPRISAIAKDMAVVIDKVTKEAVKPESIHFHIFRPEMKKVNEYTTVQVSSPVITIPD